MRAESQVRFIDKDSFFEEGERLYKKLKARLEKKHKGKIIAIEAESGQYILGEDEVSVAKEARTRFPGKVFSFFRIGYPVMHKFR
jgi:hypothetical protein